MASNCLYGAEALDLATSHRKTALYLDFRSRKVTIKIHDIHDDVFAKLKTKVVHTLKFDSDDWQLPYDAGV